MTMAVQTSTPRTFHLKVIRPTVKRVTNSNKGRKTEVYAFKSDRDIAKVSQYLFTQSSEKPEYCYRNYLFFSLGLNMGFRASDLVRLQWHHIFHPRTADYNNDDWNVLVEDKTDKTRQIVLNQSAQKAVKCYLDAMGLIPETLEPDDYVFKSRKKGHVNPDTMRVILKDAAAAVGVRFNVGTHSMRKTFGYNLYKTSNNLALVQKLLNHESEAVTTKYIGIDHETARSAYDGMKDLVWTP